MTRHARTPHLRTARGKAPPRAARGEGLPRAVRGEVLLIRALGHGTTLVRAGGARMPRLRAARSGSRAVRDGCGELVGSAVGGRLLGDQVGGWA